MMSQVIIVLQFSGDKALNLGWPHPDNDCRCIYSQVNYCYIYCHSVYIFSTKKRGGGGGAADKSSH